MTAEQRLAAFLREGQGPQLDPDFSDAVMRRVARREVLAGLATSGIFAAAATAVLWACAPALTALVEPVARTLYPVAGLLACTAAFIVISQSLVAGQVRL